MSRHLAVDLHGRIAAEALRVVLHAMTAASGSPPPEHGLIDDQVGTALRGTGTGRTSS